MCLAVPGRVLEIQSDDPLLRMAKVSFGGIVKDVSLVYVPEAKVGDYVVVHVGFAISRLAEREAEEVFSYLREMGERGVSPNGIDEEPMSGSDVEDERTPEAR